MNCTDPLQRLQNPSNRTTDGSDTYRLSDYKTAIPDVGSGHVIYHLVWAEEWLQAADLFEYAPDSLKTEGFIHATKETDMLLQVARQFYPPTLDDELLILELDEKWIPAPIIYEDPGVGHLFPHIYGPIPKWAVASVQPMGIVDGTWQLPPELANGESSL